jgi:hypothetical protein
MATASGPKCHLFPPPARRSAASWASCRLSRPQARFHVIGAARARPGGARADR